MTPKLFTAESTDFSSFGIGALAETISCKVTEERNGKYELVLTYPANGLFFDEIKTERIILAKPNETSDDQAFRIYRITTPIKNVITVYAQHISYDLANVASLPWSSSRISPTLAMQRIFTNTATSHGFACECRHSSVKSFSVARPQSVRACLGGVEGSMLDVWGGEFEWNNFNVILHAARGRNSGVVIEYAKNLTNLKHDSNNAAVYSDILPYAVYTDDSQNEHVVTLPEVTIPLIETELTHGKTLIKDMSEFFDSGSVISADELRGRTNAYIAANPLGVTVPSLDISFEPMWKQPEYVQLMEQVSLCDIVTVRHTDLGISCTTKVIKTAYDTLNEKYDSVTLGESKSNFINSVSSIQQSVSDTAKKLDAFPKLVADAIKNATVKLSGQTGGYIVINTNEVTGEPYELLIMDTNDKETAQNVWRWNLSGLGFSSTGYDGEYTTAITADGEIVADFITSGTLIANIIRAGVLSSLDGESWWDLESGEVHLTAYATTTEIENISTTIDGITTTIRQQDERSASLQTSIDGLTSYIGELTSTIEEVGTKEGESEERILELEENYSLITQSVEGLTVDVTNRFTGGINLIQNSAGLNGLSDDWTYSGTVRTDCSTEVQNNTASKCAFLLTGSSSLKQEITEAVGGVPYVVTIRAKKTTAEYRSSARITYNGSKDVYLFTTKNAFDWTEYNLIIKDIAEPTVKITITNNEGDLFVSDIFLAQGNTYHKWTPAPNEIYTNEVRIDKNGIEVSNASSSQKTVITNTEFAGYYDDEVIFTLNKDETQTKKTTVDGELTVGGVKFIPQSSPKGINIVVLD